MSDINLALTPHGAALKAKIEQGDGSLPLTITRIVTSSGTVTDPVNSSELVNEEQEFVITGVKTDGPRTAISCLLTNVGNPAQGVMPLAEGYNLWQIGIFAIDPDLGEILYRISQYENPNYVPAAGESGWTYMPTFNIITGNAPEVTVSVEMTGVAIKRNIYESIELSSDEVPKQGVRLHFFATGPRDYDITMPTNLSSAVVDPATGETVQEQIAALRNDTENLGRVLQWEDETEPT